MYLLLNICKDDKIYTKWAGIKICFITWSTKFDPNFSNSNIWHHKSFFPLISCHEIPSHVIFLNEVKMLVGFSFATYDSTICRLQYSGTHTQEYSQVVVVICQKVKRGVTTIVKVRTWYCVVDYNTIKPNHARAEENQVETLLRKFFIY